MTIQEYRWQKLKHDLDTKKYMERELLYWIKLIPIAVFGYVVIWLVGAVL